MYMAIGQCGSVLGSKIYPSTDGPKYVYVAKTFVPMFYADQPYTGRASQV